VQSEPAFWQACSAPEKLPGLFVAGADFYAGKGNGYMEGAVRSGEQAANVIIAQCIAQRAAGRRSRRSERGRREKS
jgi:hypothetical protein